MVNTINSTPEKTNKSGNNLLKKTVAFAIALTLSWEPTEAKTYEKQEFPTEIVANMPWKISPMTEKTEQASTPNYINQAQNWIKKYYPQYEEYFKPIFSELKWMWTNANNIFNKKIHENLETFEEEVTTEKDKITTILITFDNLLWEKKFTNWKKTVDTKEWEDFIKWISDEIAYEIKAQFWKELRESRENLYNSRENLYNSREKLKKINKIIEDINKNTSPEWILKSIEEFFEITDINDVKKDKSTQEIVKHYISIGKKINWKQSSLWKKFIEEYNRIK